MIDYRKLIDEIHAAHESLDDYDDPSGNRTFMPASEAEIEAAEVRLQCRFPDSYRQFLRSVNGCQKLGIAFGGLLSVEEVDWFANSHPRWVETWMKLDDMEDFSEADHLTLADDSVRFRRAYLPHLLQIGEAYDNSVYLLNPLVISAAGEWEAWEFASWFPGAKRKPSFEELVTSEHNVVLREVRLRSLQVDPESILAKAIPVLREQIAAGESPARAVAMYLATESQNSEMFAAWTRTTQSYYALLRALGLHA